MFEHVLVPLDGSRLAEEALEYAKQVVAGSGIITLLTAVDMPQFFQYEVGAGNFFEIMSAQAKAYLDQIADELRTAGYVVETEVRVGDAAELIVHTAQRLGVDAIVMTTHGRSGVSRWLFGSVTGKVLSARTCPVLVIPSKSEEKEIVSKTGAVGIG